MRSDEIASERRTTPLLCLTDLVLPFGLLRLTSELQNLVFRKDAARSFYYLTAVPVGRLHGC